MDVVQSREKKRDKQTTSGITLLPLYPDLAPKRHLASNQALDVLYQFMVGSKKGQNVMGKVSLSSSYGIQ